MSGLVQHGRPADELMRTYFDTQDKGIALLSIGGLFCSRRGCSLAIPGPSRTPQSALPAPPPPVPGS